MADAGDSITNRNVVARCVRHRVNKNTRRREKPTTSNVNGHSNLSSPARNNLLRNSSELIEDEIEGFSYDFVHENRRTVATNGHVIGDLVDSRMNELDPEFNHVVNLLTDEFEQRYKEV